MKLIDIKTHENKAYFLSLYDESFPKIEQVEPDTLFKLYNEGQIDLLVIKDCDKNIGLAVVFSKNDTALLAYFAIDKTKRGLGYGSRVLKLLIKTYNKLIVEIESTDSINAHDIEIRIRREKFYLSNGFISMDERVDYFGTDMDLLISSDSLVVSDYFDIYESIFNKDFVDNNIKSL